MLHVQYHRTGHRSLYQKSHLCRFCLALAKYSPAMSCHQLKLSDLRFPRY